MLVAIIGIVTFLNIIILKIKWEKERHMDFFFDVGAILVLNYIFGGTMTGMAIAMIASFLFSLYLLAFPPKFSF